MLGKSAAARSPHRASEDLQIRDSQTLHRACFVARSLGCAGEFLGGIANVGIRIVKIQSRRSNPEDPIQGNPIQAAMATEAALSLRLLQPLRLLQRGPL